MAPVAANVAAHYLAVPLKDKGLPPERDSHSAGQGAGAKGIIGGTKGKAVGLYGGSFNPPHEGHLLVAETALQYLRLDTLWWLVSPGNPLKDTAGLAPLPQRIAASRALITDPRIQVTAFEAALAAKNSAAMLRFIVQANPHTHFVWIMGADNLADFHLWQDWRQIMQTLPLAVIDRPNFSAADKAPAAREFAAARVSEKAAATLAEQKAPAWLFIHGRRSPLSSTMLRQSRKTQDCKARAKPKNGLKNI
ncbi:nicotinate-nucleotide adenylyltransferase [Candidatus Tokpelaia sp.]|uniref:nicotinate-nucleotide adenylyltransferase n=1 Tax=Candidatus Tokpelaia sp. TaxID=2233777 RepID=UPI001239C4A4|nr:nicotinic acid mononucleotide adenylyltransferase [Candidatus Tokpelaia sp.]